MAWDPNWILRILLTEYSKFKIPGLSSWDERVFICDIFGLGYRRKYIYILIEAKLKYHKMNYFKVDRSVALSTSSVLCDQYPSLFLGYFHPCNENPLPIKQFLFHSSIPHSPWQPPICFLLLWICLCWLYHTAGVTQYVAFCVLLFFLACFWGSSISGGIRLQNKSRWRAIMFLFEADRSFQDLRDEPQCLRGPGKILRGCRSQTLFLETPACCWLCCPWLRPWVMPLETLTPSPVHGPCHLLSLPALT